MIIPLLVALIPTLFKTAESLIPQEDKHDERKEFVRQALGKVYDKLLASRIPDFPMIDERELFITVGDHLVDFLYNKVVNSKDESH